MILLRATALLFLLLGLGSTGAEPAAQAAGRVISKTEARRLGLERAWYTQIGLDRARERVAQFVLSKDMLLVLTDRSVVHALDAETGQRRWTAQIGQSRYPSLEMTASDSYVALVNGSTLYVVNRATGRPVWDHVLDGAPGAGPAVAGEYVYVPLMRSKIEAYDLQATEHSPWMYSTDGRISVAPLATSGGVCWPTDRSHLYLGRADTPGVLFRVETGGAIVTRPAYQKPYFYVASVNGYVYAIGEETGKRQWRFSAGSPIRTPLAVIRPPVGERANGHVYVCPEQGGMFCLAEQSGHELWWASKISQPVAVTPEHVYGADPLGQLHILDIKTGAHLGVLKPEETSRYLLNQQTDRVYLASETGLIHCLRETELDEPIQYVERATGEEAAGETPSDGQAKGAETAVEPPQPE